MDKVLAFLNKFSSGGQENEENLEMFPSVPKSHTTNGSPRDETSKTLKNTFHLPTYTHTYGLDKSFNYDCDIGLCFQSAGMTATTTTTTTKTFLFL